MSRHSKRISVFDRLGPDNERDSSSHHPPPPPPPHPPSVRHRHYSDKHGVIQDDRQSRDKREPDRLPRKRRHGFEEDSMSGSSPSDSRGKRDKPIARRSDPRDRSYSDKSRRTRSSTSHSSTEGGESEEDRRKSLGHVPSTKRSKSQRGSESGRGRERTGDDKMAEGEKRDSDYSHGEDERLRRKREKESGSDGEERKDSKRRKTDDGGKRGGEDNAHHNRDASKRRERKNEGASLHKRGNRKRSLYDSFTESETENQSDINWLSLVKLPLIEAKEKKPKALDSFTAGAVLSKIGISAELAGPELMNKIRDTMIKDLAKKYDCCDDDFFDLFGSNGECKFGGPLATRMEQQMVNKRLVVDIGACRKALVAGVDFNIRKRLRNMKKNGEPELLPSTGLPSTWDPDLYSSSVSLYHSGSTL